MSLPIRRLTLFQHGLGFFGRAGDAEQTFTLDVPRRAMDDVLKSLTILPDGASVRSIAFETPPDRNPNAHRQPLALDRETPLTSLIAAFSGRRVSVQIGNRHVVGELVGLEREESDHLKRAVLAVSGADGVELVALSAIQRLTLLDDAARADLSFAMEEQRRDLERAQARVSLSKAAPVVVSYAAPAPSWRTSYRVLIAAPPEGAESDRREVVLQGWGLFDNTLDEDLVDVDLTLTAGMPVSFRYELHQPNTPDRPVLRDTRRVLAETFSFDAMPMAAGAMETEMAAAPMTRGEVSRQRAMKAKPTGTMTAESFSDAAPVQAVGESRGALFAYRVSEPVSVRRGESGMVPITEVRGDGSRELLYNPTKTPGHPAASVRFRNTGGVLDYGPATVLEAGDYAGEAVVPFTADGAEVVLGYALELGIHMSQRTSVVTQTRTLRIRDGGAFVGVIDRFETTYAARSDLAQSVTVTVEHPRNHGCELRTDTVAVTADLARVLLPVAARSEGEVVVVETRTRDQWEDVRSLDAFRLQQFLAGKVIDDRVFSALNSVQEYYARIATADSERSRREDDRARLRARLDDARANLGSLDPARDGQLRDRFVSQLETFEDQLALLDRADEEARVAITSWESEISTLLASLAQPT